MVQKPLQKSPRCPQALGSAHHDLSEQLPTVGAGTHWGSLACDVVFTSTWLQKKNTEAYRVLH